MLQRTITAFAMIAVVSVLLYFGGIAITVGVLVCVLVSVAEEYNALSKAGHRLITWPTWLAVVISVPLMYFFGGKVLIPVAAGTAILTASLVMFRAQPKLEDVLMSILPLISVVLPGMCMEAMSFIPEVEVQREMICLMICIPIMGDTLALYVGSALQGPKLCPEVSPKKTISGAVGGLIGSMLAALAIAVITRTCCSAEIIALMPQLWTYAVIGVVGGLAGQMGDLFASLVKRHCGLKDFSNMFPGHGGMMDRLDSIYFSALVVYCVRLMGTGI